MEFNCIDSTGIRSTNGFLITDNCKQASKNFRSYRINIIFVSSRLGILRSSIGLRLNTAMKLIYQLKGGWEPGSKMDEKSQRTGDRWLRLHSFTYRASKFDGNFLENSRQRYRWYRYIGRQNICAPLQPRYPFVSHRSNMLLSLVYEMIFRKLWKWTIVTCEKRTRILFSVIYDWYFENYENSNDRGRFYSHWSTIKLWKFYSNDRGTWKANDFIDALVLDREIWLEENSTWIYIID